MKQNDGQQNPMWPAPLFRFEAGFGEGLTAKFQNISGMDAGTSDVRHDELAPPVLPSRKMPDIPKDGNLVMKRGIFANNSSFWDWYKKVVMNTVHKTVITVKLLDENGKAVVKWTLKDAWPVKITVDLHPEGADLVAESVEVSYGKITESKT